MQINNDKSIMDYLMEQADIFDDKNIITEERLINSIMDSYDDMANRVLDLISIHDNIITVLQSETLINRIKDIVESFYNEAYRKITKNVTDYAHHGYSNMGELLDMGQELTKQASHRVTEIGKKQMIPDTEAIRFLQNHSFTYIKDMSDNIIYDIRASIANSLIKGKYNRIEVRESIQNIFKTTASRAETIAQTEMSMAYNYGAIQRLTDFSRVSGEKVMKYWYGFKYSDVTCTYCRPRIGNIYALDDTSEILPAHPRCRCAWLPYIDGWNAPISSAFTRKADMSKRGFIPDEIYSKINARFGIDYAKYINLDDATRYITGDRTNNFYEKVDNARKLAIKDVSSDFDIAKLRAETIMNAEYLQQISFWKKYVASAIVDKDLDVLNRSYEAIKGIMILPWTANQLNEFNKLLDIIAGHRTLK